MTSAKTQSTALILPDYSSVLNDPRFGSSQMWVNRARKKNKKLFSLAGLQEQVEALYT